MACNNLVVAAVVSNQTPDVGETISCTATVTNTGFLTETYHIIFTSNGEWVGQSGVITLDPTNIHGTTVNFIAESAGNAEICANLVCDTTVANKISITSPNGGEVWQRGTSHTITWNYTGTIGDSVIIILYKGGVTVGTIAEGVPIGTGGTGSYIWNIFPSSQNVGNDITISIYNEANNAIYDRSDSYFTLTPA